MKDTGIGSPETISFEKIAELGRERAAGGQTCALYVLELINAVHKKQGSTKSVVCEVEIFNEHGEVESTSTVQPIAKLCNDVSIGVRVEEGVQKETSDDNEFDLFAIYQPRMGTNQGFRLWTLKEVPVGISDDPMECSRAQFHPASDFGEWDWSIVATKADDENSPTATHAVEKPYLTNKDIITRLRDIVRGKPEPEGITLADDLMIDRLLAKYIPSSRVEGLIEPPSESRFRAKNILEDIIRFYTLAGAKEVPPIIINGFRFIPNLSMGHLDVDQIYNDLGTKPRHTRIGALHPDASGEDFLFFSDLGGDKPIGDFPITAEQIFNIPRVMDAPKELIIEISNLLEYYSNATLSELENVSAFDSELIDIIHNYRTVNGIDKGTYIDIGSIDIRHIQQTEFFHSLNRRHGLPQGYKSFGDINCIVSVFANSDQTVFIDPNDYKDKQPLFGCSVSGAKEAFKEIRGHHLSATNCVEAFRGAWANQCSATQCDIAFRHAQVDRSIARECRIAYWDAPTVHTSIASYCMQAYISERQNTLDWQGNTAEQCQESFVSFYTSTNGTTTGFGREDVLGSENTIIIPSRSSFKYHAPRSFDHAVKPKFIFKIQKPELTSLQWSPLLNKDGNRITGVRLSDKERSKRRKSIAKISTALLLFGYSHLFFGESDKPFMKGIDNANVEVNSLVPFVDVPVIGDMPLPLMPIEVINDLANGPDHSAQGFEKPEGAEEINEKASDIPLITDYDTAGVPDASFSNDENRSPIKEILKPGLYKVDMSMNDGVVTNEYNDDDTLRTPGNTFEIEIDANGPISVFTTNPVVAGQLQSRIDKEKNVVVVELKPEFSDQQLLESDLYFYSQH